MNTKKLCCRRLAIFSFFMLLVSSGNSQTSTQKNEDPPSAKTDTPYPNHIKWTVGRVFDPGNPGIQLAYEHQHGLKYASQMTATLLKDLLGITDKKGLKGFTLSFEEKKFIRQVRNHTRSYIAAEVVYLDGRHIKNLYDDTDDAETLYNQVTIHKRTYSANFKGGCQIMFSHFIFDIFGGAGIKYKDVSHSSRSAQNNDPYSPVPEPKSNYNADRIGRRFTVSVPVSFKFGYAF